ncbi:hypothetical protein J8L98_22120 [Pseudoalteromonas sp. MMG013]|uniref:hypothetical protein n=1 Tax=Pseudoalteromonas sp. MMG013 TaxID=2822687 RepID=UPI001B3601DC|nr:hypothetical protein [Pseudoalteromonas sp. MMG013]MBQ4864392.1 hypothetical protein [Pseudoalteromonas sp. MMG013]
MNVVSNIAEIQKCMSDLGISLVQNLQNPVNAGLFNNKTLASGDIVVNFNNNFQSGDGPFIELDDVIRSFGIQYQVFKPQFQTFSYDPNQRELTVSGDCYEFSLTF